MTKRKETKKRIPNDKGYNGVVIFDEPVKIKDDEGKPIPIFGILYNKDEKHRDDIWLWELNRFLTYLVASARVQERNGKIAPEMWILGSGQTINLNVENKNLIYRLLKDEIPSYKVKEFDEPFKDIKEGETEGEFVVSESFLERYGYEIISFDTMIEERKHEKTY